MVEPKASTTKQFFKDGDAVTVIAAALSAAGKLALHATGRTTLPRGEVDRLRAQLAALLEVIDAQLP